MTDLKLKLSFAFPQQPSKPYFKFSDSKYIVTGSKIRGSVPGIFAHYYRYLVEWIRPAGVVLFQRGDAEFSEVVRLMNSGQVSVEQPWWELDNLDEFRQVRYVLPPIEYTKHVVVIHRISLPISVDLFKPFQYWFWICLITSLVGFHTIWAIRIILTWKRILKYNNFEITNVFNNDNTINTKMQLQVANVMASLNGRIKCIFVLLATGYLESMQKIHFECRRFSKKFQKISAIPIFSVILSMFIIQRLYKKQFVQMLLHGDFSTYHDIHSITTLSMFIKEHGHYFRYYIDKESNVIGSLYDKGVSNGPFYNLIQPSLKEANFDKVYKIIQIPGTIYLDAGETTANQLCMHDHRLLCLPLYDTGVWWTTFTTQNMSRIQSNWLTMSHCYYSENGHYQYIRRNYGFGQKFKEVSYSHGGLNGKKLINIKSLKSIFITFLIFILLSGCILILEVLCQRIV